ncbi:MAG: insulinase family protein, partial [Chloroflexi bacterium]|nr:insulinase family protein [Chloroflexota bacterium]
MTQTPQNLPHAGNILRTSFDNGSTLLAWHNSTSPAVVIQGLLRPGTVADTPGQYGLANLTAAMLMTGTQKHDFQALHEKIESLGASIHVQSGKLMSSFALQCL